VQPYQADPTAAITIRTTDQHLVATRVAEACPIWHDTAVTAPEVEFAIRDAALAWLQGVTQDGTVAVTREQLANDFQFAGERFPLIDRGRGIRKPLGWHSALSISTAATPPGKPGPYDDIEGPDGLQRYKLRRDQRGSTENEALRNAMREQVPLIWFFGARPGLFQAIFPVYLIREEPEQDQFVLALTEEQRTLQPASLVEETLRRYVHRLNRQRLHQPVFAARVMAAYETRCAVCRLGHRELLDAAHIIGDREEHGIATVTNGLALCKIHHAAYDRNILGIRPDYVVEVHGRLLDEIDGPMLRYGLQEHHGKQLMQLPSRRAEKPDPDRLQERYAQFAAA